jgi:hypothetical protein
VAFVVGGRAGVAVLVREELVVGAERADGGDDPVGGRRRQDRRRDLVAGLGG